MAWCPYDTCIASFFSNLPPLPVNTTPPSARAAYHAVQPPSAHPPHCLQWPCLQRMPPPPPLPPPSRSAAAFRSCQLCVAEEATAGCRCCSATALSSCFYISQVKQRKYLVKKKEDSKQVICCGCCQPHAPCHSTLPVTACCSCWTKFPWLETSGQRARAARKRSSGLKDLRYLRHTESRF